MADNQLDITVKLVDEASGSLKKINGEIGALGGEVTKVTKKASTDWGKLSSNFAILGTSMIAAGASIGLALKSAIDASSTLSDSLLGLGSVAEAFGVSADAANQAAISLAADGLMPVSDAATGLKNLLASGFSLDEATQLMLGFKDSAAFGRQGALDFGQAIVGATEGIKNGNSILVDNAGITKNLSVILEEAGGSAQDLGKASTDAGVRMAIYNGILKETSTFQGQAASLTGQYSGKVIALKTSIFNLQATIGDRLKPSLVGIVDQMKKAVDGITSWMRENPALVETVVKITAAVTALVVVVGGFLLSVAAVIKIFRATQSAYLDLIPLVKGLAVFLLTTPLGWFVVGLAAVVVAMRHMGMTWTEIINWMITAVEVVLTPLSFFFDMIIDGINTLTGKNLPTVGEGFDFIRAKVTDFGSAVGAAADGISELANNLTKPVPPINDLSGSAESAGKKVSEAFAKMGDGADKLNEDIKEAMEESIKNVASLQREMENLKVGNIEDVGAERSTLAGAYVAQEQEAADLRVEIAAEEDREKRGILQDRLKVIEEDLKAHANIETAFAFEVNQIRENARKTDLQKAIDAFQKNILMIGQKFEAEYNAINAKLAAEMDAQKAILEVKEVAERMAKEFLLSGEKATLESINRQIDAYARLAEAVQMAKQGKAVAKVSLGATTTAQDQIQSLAGVSTMELSKKTEATVAAATNNVTINVNNTSVWGKEEVMEKIGDPIMAMFKQHYSFV